MPEAENEPEVAEAAEDKTAYYRDLQTFVEELHALDLRAKAAGHSLSAILEKTAQGFFGISIAS